MSKKKSAKSTVGLTWQRTGPESLPEAQQLIPRAVVPGDDPSSNGQLILGENMAVMAGLLEKYEGKIDLIYADPPFLTGNTYPVRVGRGEDSRSPSEWQTVEAYQDTWEDRSSYLSMLYDRLALMHSLLAEDGSLYLHLDWRMSAYARVMLDELFGEDRLLNEIIWVYHGPSPIKSAFKRKHDTILSYTKSKQYTFNADEVRIPYEESTKKTFASSKKAGFGKVPDLERGKVPEDWWYFPVVARLHNERTGYPTQKPEALLERIIQASSNSGDLVADFFCGAGTFGATAARLGRSWILCDQNQIAVQTSYRRMLLQVQKPAFTLYTADEHEWQPEFIPNLLIDGSDGETFTFQIQISDVEAESNSLDDLVMWEIDPAPQGEVFASRYQSVLGWRDEQVKDMIKVPVEVIAGNEIGIRAVNKFGQLGQNRIRLDR